MAIGTAIEITDRMTGPLNRITAALNTTIDALNSADQATNTAFNSAGIQAVTQELYEYEMRMQEIQDELNGANDRIQKMQDELNSANDKMQKLQEQTEKARNSADALEGVYRKVAAVIGAFATAQTFEKVLGASDELTATTARLDMMNESYKKINGGLETTNQLVQLVYASAQDARGSFGDMAAVVAKFGNNAKDAFGSSAEVVDFANLVQKEMVIAGASTTEASNAMLQLSQAMGSGVLRGDELNSIFEQAPNLIQNIADYMEVPIGDIREMASEGELSADIVKQAIFSASDEINDKFNSMPMTWSQLWTSMQNKALMTFQPVLQRLNDIANSDDFQTFADGAMDSLGTLANVAVGTIDILVQGAGFIADNWSVIEPAVIGAATALGIYAGVLIIYNAAQKIGNDLTKLAAFQESVHTAAIEMKAGATFRATAAQYGLNAALLACPLTWIVLAIIAVIAAIYLVVAAINKVQGTTYSATGFICGAVLTAGAFIGNTAIGLLNALMQYCWSMFVQPFIELINFVLNAAGGGFDSFGAMVANLIGTIIGWFLNLGTVVTKIIDAIFGTDWTIGLNLLADNVKSWGMSEGYVEYISDEAPVIEKRFNYGDAYNTGKQFGQSVDDKISSMFSSGINLPSYDDLLSSAGYNSSADNIAATLGDISKDTSAIADSVDISNENLQYMRDLAERDVINRFTTATVNVNMGGVNNNVSQNTDLDGVISYLKDGVTEAVQQAAEGVHI